MSQLRRVSAGGMLLAITCLAQSNLPVQPALELSLQQAIEIATSARGDTTVQVAQEGERLTYSRYTEARASLLPTLDGSVAEQDQTVNPRALGLQFESPYFTVPNEVGPFNTFDARIRLSQNLLNLSAVRHSQAAHQDFQAAKSETGSVREHAAGAVARLYAAALRADAQLEVSKANIADAEALRNLASHRLSAGEGTELDVASANLNLARDRQKMLTAQTGCTRTRLSLIKILNLDWNTALQLTGKLDDKHEDTPDVAQSMAIAVASRADFKMEEERIASARLSQSSAKLERMPSIVVYGDYGVLAGVQTHTVGAALRVPLFDGGRMESDRLQAASLLRQEQIRAAGLRREIELEVRQALAALNSTAQQIQVAEQAITLAQEELARAHRRFDAGLINGTEVIDAQTQLEVARYDRVEALFNYVEARIDWAEATGTVRKMVL